MPSVLKGACQVPWEGRLCPSGVSGNSSAGQMVPHHLGGHSSWWKQLELNLLAKWGGHQPQGEWAVMQ